MKSTLAAVKRQRFPSQASRRVPGLFILGLCYLHNTAVESLIYSIYEISVMLTNPQNPKYIQAKVERVGVLNFCLHAVAIFHHFHPSTSFFSREF